MEGRPTAAADRAVFGWAGGRAPTRPPSPPLPPAPQPRILLPWAQPSAHCLRQERKEGGLFAPRSLPSSQLTRRRVQRRIVVDVRVAQGAARDGVTADADGGDGADLEGGGGGASIGKKKKKQARPSARWRCFSKERGVGGAYLPDVCRTHSPTVHVAAKRLCDTAACSRGARRSGERAHRTLACGCGRHPRAADARQKGRFRPRPPTTHTRSHPSPHPHTHPHTPARTRQTVGPP